MERLLLTGVAHHPAEGAWTEAFGGKMSKNRACFLVAAAAAAFAAAPASAARIVVDFESFSGTGLVPESYGGINWNDNFSYYDAAEPPFTPKSGTVVGFPNYAKLSPAVLGTLSFTFDAPVLFEELWFAGRDHAMNVTFLLDGVVQGSRTLTIGSEPTRFAGFRSPINQVSITGVSGFWVMDDITYETNLAAAVPEPSAWAMLIAGFGLAGFAIRRARRTGSGAMLGTT